MKKLLKKDKKNRKTTKNLEKKHFILKNIIKNHCYLKFFCWKSFLVLSNLSKKSYKNKLINWCLFTGNKKRTNKFYNYSRFVFLKLIKIGLINNIKKLVW